jgi:hypothetical protein
MCLHKADKIRQYIFNFPKHPCKIMQIMIHLQTIFSISLKYPLRRKKSIASLKKLISNY